MEPPGARILFTEGEIQGRVGELARELEVTIREQEVPLLIGMLRGSLLFMADLVRHLSTVSLDFLSLSRFSGARSGRARVRIEKDLEIDVTDRRVVIVEDVVDTGLTLSFLRTSLLSRGARSVEVLALLNKRVRRIIDIPIEFVGFEIGDEFVLGYGLDYAQLYRNIPFVFGVDDLDRLVAQPDSYLPFALEMVRGGEDAQMASKSQFRL